METLPPASEEALARFAHALVTLASAHGLSNLRLAGTGRLVADVDPGRTYLDVADFELEAQGVLGADLDVVLSGTRVAEQIGKRLLLAVAARD